MALKIDSLTLLPEELQSMELYQIVCDLINQVLEVCKVEDSQEEIIDDLINDLIPDYGDVESVNTWYRIFIKPTLGTKTAVQSGFKLVQDPGKILEWWEAGISAYHFAIEYQDDLPENISIAEIIRLVNKLKNERSHLISIRNPYCEQSLIWDYNKWDWTWYDTVAGVVVDDVYVCLRRREGQFVPVSEIDPKVYSMVDLHYQQLTPWIYYEARWDYFNWDWKTQDANSGMVLNSYFNYVFLDPKVNLVGQMNVESYISDVVPALPSEPKSYEFQTWMYGRIASVSNQWAGSWDTNKTWQDGGSPYGCFSRVGFEVIGLREFQTNEYFEFTEDDQEFNLIFDSIGGGTIKITPITSIGAGLFTQYKLTLRNF